MLRGFVATAHFKSSQFTRLQNLEYTYINLVSIWGRFTVYTLYTVVIKLFQKSTSISQCKQHMQEWSKKNLYTVYAVWWTIHLPFASVQLNFLIQNFQQYQQLFEEPKMSTIFRSLSWTNAMLALLDYEASPPSFFPRWAVLLFAYHSGSCFTAQYTYIHQRITSSEPTTFHIASSVWKIKFCIVHYLKSFSLNASWSSCNVKNENAIPTIWPHNFCLSSNIEPPCCKAASLFKLLKFWSNKKLFGYA
jgi:hypothetical protein